MTALDIIFWLLVALLGGVAWSIELGLGQRYRNLLASSVLAACGSGLVIMFWVEDNTVYRPAEKQEFGKRKKEEGDGTLEQVETEKKKKSKDTGEQPTGNTGENAKAKDDLDENEVVYSREPFNDCPVCPEMVIVPSGLAHIGAAPDDAARTADEQPATTIPIPQPFAIGRLEIARTEFERFVKESGHESRGPCETGRKRGAHNWQKPAFEQDHRHPVVCVTWTDVRLYLEWLSKKSDRNYRLPTEIEWEHAARAGSQTPYWLGNTLARSDANIGRVRDGTTVGGMFKISPFGLSDLIGNAGELIADCAAEPNTQAPSACRRIVKGGSWSTPAAAGRHAARATLMDGMSANTIGFRVARDVDQRDDGKRLTPAQRRETARLEKQAAEAKAKEEERIEAAKRKARLPPPPPPPPKK